MPTARAPLRSLAAAKRFFRAGLFRTPSQTFAAARNSLSAITDVKPATWLALVLLALFLLERILTHARRN
jgi:hypothetical protein